MKVVASARFLPSNSVSLIQPAHKETTSKRAACSNEFGVVLLHHPALPSCSIAGQKKIWHLQCKIHFLYLTESTICPPCVESQPPARPELAPRHESTNSPTSCDRLVCIFEIDVMMHSILSKKDKIPLKRPFAKDKHPYRRPFTKDKLP